LLRHEKKAFWKFFSIYFGSVALLILVTGFFYFEDQKKSMIEKEHFSMIEYVRKFKMKEPLLNQTNITHEIKDLYIEDFSMENFEINENYFIKYMPHKWEGGYLLVKKDKSFYYVKLFEMKLYIITVQVLLLMFFATLSYFLSMRALKPMQEAITKLDNFSKDLIHDLNTPITSILLNMKLLNKVEHISHNKALQRIKRSVEDISELHNSLTILLEEETMLIQNENISEMVEDVILTHKRLFPDIKYESDIESFYAHVNKKAFKQILVNLISNASKYNAKNGFVKIYVENETLCIQDSGVGIKNVDEVFERSYKEHVSGHGLGLDIVKRLCEAMEIKITLSSKVGEGTTFFLKLKGS